MSGTPYISSDDSALLRGALRGRSGGTCLEIGAGNGGNLVELAKGFETTAGTDVTRPSMRDWTESSDMVLADRAGCFRDGVFDLVALNPPYLAGGGTGDLAVDGGPGLEVPLAFLEEALRVVRKDGRVVLLLNQEADLGVFEEACGRRGFGLRRVSSVRLFFEVLSVYEAAPADGHPHSRSPSEGARSGHSETSTARRLHQVPASPS
ncbi:MAG: hypothetical protein JRM80_13930 [Nitrososphaerota archaeon]|nr:hypothetical protein [Nitrososphaerota archaeon]MDG6983625.1 hypothetical protein [Nitrososphaerota archaeon]